MIDETKGIISAFKIYKEKKYRHFEMTNDKYHLLSPNDRFLPFIYKRNQSVHQISVIRVVDIDGNVIFTHANANDVVSVYESDTFNQDFVIYYGAIIAGMVLPCGYYSLEIEDSGGEIHYSEHFSPQSDLTELIKLEFWNDTNVGNIIYEFGFKQVLYFDSKITKPVPKLEKKAEKDGNDNTVFSFLKGYLEYTFEMKPIPIFLVKVLNIIDANEHIVLSNPYQKHENPKEFTLFGKWIDRDRVWLGGMTFYDCEIIKTGCEENSDLRLLGSPAPSNQVPVISNVFIVGAPVSLNPNPLIPIDLSGNPSVGKVTTLTYNYFDAEGDLAGIHLYRWQRSNNGGGVWTDIVGANEEIYTPINDDDSKFIRCGITPVALTGNSPGIEVFSNAAYVTGGKTQFDLTLSQGAGAITGGDVPVVVSISPISTTWGSAFVSIDAGVHGVYSNVLHIVPGDSSVNGIISIIPNSGDIVTAIVTIQSANASENDKEFVIANPSIFSLSFDPNTMG